MLYLNPPFWVINGISLFPDHADPAQYYYLPMMPHLSATKDGDKSIPQIQLIKYRGHEQSGGFLSCDVDLGIPQELLDETADALRRQAKLDQRPRLAPVPVVDGTVKLILLGNESVQPPEPSPRGAAQPPPAPRFVIKIQSASRPSLYGDENATFSVQLDADGTTIIEKALQGELSPVGVVYSLDFFALRPAYSVRVNIDWNRVQKHFEENCSSSFIFFSSEVDKMIDELVEKRTIVVEADTFVAEGEDTRDIMARRDQAMAEVRDMIKGTFFESSILPPKPGEPDAWSKAAGFANEVSRLALTHGASSLGGLSYKRSDLTRIDRKSLNATFQERTTVRKTICPQAHLAGLFRVLRSGLPLERFIVPVDLDNPYFQRRQVEVISRADFERDAIQSISVRLTYGNQVQTVLLEPGPDKERQKVEWASRLADGVMARPVDYSYAVTFKNVDRSERPVSLSTDELGLKLSTVQDKLEIIPREKLYTIAEVPITMPAGFPWDRYPSVQVECRYQDEVNKIDQHSKFPPLTKGLQPPVFQLFLRDPTKRRFEYRITYFGASEPVRVKDLSTEWTPADDEQVPVRDPFPTRRQLTIVPQLDWATVERAFVDVTYKNGPGDDDEVCQSFEFSSTDSGSKTFSVNPVDVTKKKIGYAVTLLLTNKTTVSVPPSHTMERRLILRGDMRGHRMVSIVPPQIDFADAGIDTLTLEVRHLDEKAGLSYAGKRDFKSKEDEPFIFEFDYVSEAQSGYEYRLTVRRMNLPPGLPPETWTPASDDTLNLAVT